MDNVLTTLDNVLTTLAPSFFFFLIFFILAGNKDIHKSLDDFKFQAVE